MLEWLAMQVPYTCTFLEGFGEMLLRKNFETWGTQTAEKA